MTFFLETFYFISYQFNEILLTTIYQLTPVSPHLSDRQQGVATLMAAVSMFLVADLRGKQLISG